MAGLKKRVVAEKLTELERLNPPINQSPAEHKYTVLLADNGKASQRSFIISFTPN